MEHQNLCFTMPTARLCNMIIKGVIIFFLASCGTPAVKSKLSGSDSVVIHYYFPATDSVSKTINTTQKAAINKLIGFADGPKSEKYKCGYDGDMVFYKQNQQTQSVKFKYKDKSCRHFLMDIDGKLVSTKLNNEAFDFFTSLDQGKDYY